MCAVSGTLHKLRTITYSLINICDHSLAFAATCTESFPAEVRSHSVEVLVSDLRIHLLVGGEVDRLSPRATGRIGGAVMEEHF